MTEAMRSCAAPGCTATAWWYLPGKQPACDRHLMHGWHTSPPKAPVGIVEFVSKLNFEKWDAAMSADRTALGEFARKMRRKRPANE